MKAQGLPINFIVIAALAILILILAAGFAVAGGAAFSSAVGPEQARTTCNNFCITSQRSAADVYDPLLIGDEETLAAGTWMGDAATKQRFCTARFDVKGVGENKTCTELVGSCLVTFGDGTTYSVDAITCGHATI